MNVTFVEEPLRSGHGDGTSRVLRLLDIAASRFESVIHVKATLRDACPATGFVLVSSELSPDALLGEFSPELRRSVARRLVAVGIGSRRRDALAMLDRLQMPAALDALMVAEIETPARPTILGRVDIAQKIGAATWVPQYMDYCVIASEAHTDSLHLLADYLRAFEQRD